MSRKLPKKVTKVTQRPRTLGKSYEVIKHFIPRSCNILPLNGRYQIPEINLEDSNESEYVFKRSANKRKSALPKEKHINSEKKKIPESKPYIKCAIKPQYKSSSSSSVEDKLEKFNNIKKWKVHTEKSRIKNRSKSNLEATHLKAKNNSLKSLTDPVLIEKQSQVEAIKKEILDKKKLMETNYDSQWSGDSNHVQDIRDEIFQMKNKNIVNRQILITELKTEIAEYKRYNMFHIYNQHGISQGPCDENKLYCDKSEQFNVGAVEIKNNEELAKESTVEDGCVKDNPKQITDESSTTSVQGNHDLVLGKTNAYADLVDDDVIKQKIEDANVLIEKVKKALGKIKTIKPVSVEDYTETSNDSSTDIEQTIKKLKKQADELIKGAEIVNKSQTVSEEKPESHVSQSDRDTRDNTKDADTFYCQERLLNQEFDLDQRPKTRRSSFEDDQSEGYRLNKFRSTPENNQPEIDSSLEALQEKLQTISEGTESSISTPKHVTSTVMPAPKDVKSCGCNTDPLGKDYKQIQVDTKKTSVSLGTTTAETKHQPVQTDDNVLKKQLHKENNQAIAIPPAIKNLTQKCFDGQDIVSQRKSSARCKVTVLPVEEIPPVPPKIIDRCALCLKQLKKASTSGVCINSTCLKKKQLVVQKLPPVIVRPAFTKTQVVNFTITPNGTTENFLDNSHNIRFVMIKDHSLIEQQFNKTKQEDPNNASDPDRQIVYQSFLIYDNPNFHLPEPLDKRSKEKMSMMNLDVYKTYINPEGWSEGREVPEFLFSKEVQCDMPPEKQPEEKPTEPSKEETRSSLIEDTRNTVKLKNSIAVQTSVGHDLDQNKTPVQSQISADHLEDKHSIDPGIYLQGYYSESAETAATKREHKNVMIDTFPNEEGPIETKKMSKISTKGIIVQDKISDHKPDFYQDKTTSIEPIEEPNKTVESYRNIATIETLPIQTKSTSDEEKENDKAFSEPASMQDKSKSSQPIQQDQVTEETYSSKIKSISMYRNDPSRTPLAIEESDLSQLFKKEDNNQASTIINVYQDTPSDYSLPSEVTLTISYSTDSNESSVLRQVAGVRKRNETRQGTEQEIDCIEYNSDQNIEENRKKIFPKNMNTISKVKEKLKVLDTSLSNPILNMSQSMTQSGETVNKFIKGLTLVTTNSGKDTNTAHPETSSKKPNEKQNINYCFITSPQSSSLSYSSPLELDKNGRYKDEANLFVPNVSLIPKRNHRTILGGFSGNKHLENPRSKLLTLPKQMRRYSPDTSNSDTITTLSDGEILCKHSISNGEVHQCNTRYSSNGGRPKRNVLSRTYDFYERARKHFEFSDKKIIVEQRRNHFNNWVTYYIKAQERINDSSTSSCSNNK